MTKQKTPESDDSGIPDIHHWRAFARKNLTRQDYAYIQVAMTIAAQNTEDHEYAPLEKIRDSWPKYVLTLDPLLQRRSGIRHLNIRDVFLQNIDF